MNLEEVVEALGHKDITVALDMGVHRDCDINSNCPLAVELRRIVTESGITTEQLLEGFAAGQTGGPEPIPMNTPEFDGKSSITVAGETIEIDFTTMMRQQVQVGFDRKVRELSVMNTRLQRVGTSLYASYLKVIDETRKSARLPQLAFTIKELMQAGCLTTSSGSRYLFIFPRVYSPEYIIDTGIRYQMADEDKARVKRNILIVYTISPDYKITSLKITKTDGDGFEHYHGSTRDDCWGMITLPPKWDGKLKSLADFTIQLVGSLHTINKNSLMTHEPAGMPHTTNIFERSKKLGKEGVTPKKEKVEEVVPLFEVEGTPARGWGRTGGTGWQIPMEGTGGVAEGTTPEDLTPEQQEMHRRFGVTTRPGDMGIICAVCGNAYGGHFLVDGMNMCPREHEVFRRFGVTLVIHPANPTCSRCALEYNAHYGHTCPRDLGAPATGSERQREMAQFGVTHPAMEVICNCCGRTYGEHGGTNCLRNRGG